MSSEAQNIPELHKSLTPTSKTADSLDTLIITEAAQNEPKPDKYPLILSCIIKVIHDYHFENQKWPSLQYLKALMPAYTPNMEQQKILADYAIYQTDNLAQMQAERTNAGVDNTIAYFKTRTLFNVCCGLLVGALLGYIVKRPVGMALIGGAYMLVYRALSCFTDYSLEKTNIYQNYRRRLTAMADSTLARLESSERTAPASSE